MVMAPRSGGLPGDKLPWVCHHWPELLGALHQTLQMGAPLYRSPVGDITSPCRNGIDDESKHIYLNSHLPNQFYFYRPSAGLLAYWLFAGEDGRGSWVRGGRGMVKGWAWEKRGEGQEGLMAFTIFNAAGCHHWISILNNVAFHHKFFTTYLLNGKSYGSLSGW